MSAIDIGIIALVVLFALIGLWKGTGKALIKLICFLLAVLACFLLSDSFLKFLMGVDAIRNLALGDTISVYRLISSSIGNASEATGVIKMLYDPLIARFEAIGGAAAWGATEDQFLAVAMSLHLFTVLMVLVLYAAARILASILGYVLKIIFIHDGAPNLLSRLIGLAIGAAHGAVVVVLVLFLTSAIFPFSFAATINDQMTKSKVTSSICSVEYPFLTEKLYSNQTLELMMSAKFEKITPPEAPETPEAPAEA